MSADYVNYQNYELQNDPDLMIKSLFFYAISLLTFLIVILICNSTSSVAIKAKKYVGLGWKLSYFVSIIAFTYFYWLMDRGMGFSSIFSSTYSELLEMRKEGLRFAAVLGHWFFSLSLYLYYSRRIQSKKYDLNDYLFVFFALGSALLMFLHSSRMPLLAMILSTFILLSSSKNSKKINFALGFCILALWALGAVRELVASGLIFKILEDTSEINVASIPGGMSNAYMSFVINVDYFETKSFFAGQTFINYIGHLIPSDVFSLLNLSKPIHFENVGIFDKYDWNGGINAISVFYANFGFIGLILHGVYSAMWAIIATKLIIKCTIGRFVLAAYIIGFALPSFIYEPIQLIKPMFFLFIAVYLLELTIPKRDTRV